MKVISAVHVVFTYSPSLCMVHIQGPVLASSIHAIHRPIARVRHGDTPFISKSPKHDGEYFGYNRSHGSMVQEQSPDELNEVDFELGDAEVSTLKGKAPIRSEVTTPSTRTARGPMLRAGSMATVRVQRRAKLACKLREVFDLDDIEEVVAGSFSLQSFRSLLLIIKSEMPCWLLRSVRKSYLVVINVVIGTTLMW